MSGVRETYERNLEGLKDLYLKYENDIKASLQNLINQGQYEDALKLVDEKINFAILDFEKRKKDVQQILQTKASLSFNDGDQVFLSNWVNAVVDAISKIEMLGSSFVQQINQKVTESVRIPAIEKFLLEAEKRKAFSRLTYDFVAKRLNVPRQKVEEVVEDLVFDGKLSATIDQVTGTIIFAQAGVPAEHAAPQSTPSITPAPTPPPISSVPVTEREPQEGLPQPVALDTPAPEGPQLIDLSLEPPEIPDEIIDTPPDTLEIPPEIDIGDTETIDLSPEGTTPTETAPAAVQEPEPSSVPEAVPAAGISVEEKEARSIISFFKDSVQELSEDEKAEARRKREEKRKKMLEAKKKKQEEEAQSVEEETEEVESLLEDVESLIDEEKTETLPSEEPAKADAQPVGDTGEEEAEDLKAPPSETPMSELIGATGDISRPSDEKVKCVICGKDISKDDPTVIPCPHACGAYGHKAEFLEKGACPKCEEKITEMDVEFSTLL
jgi:hypothetical protein